MTVKFGGMSLDDAVHYFSLKVWGGVVVVEFSSCSYYLKFLLLLSGCGHENAYLHFLEQKCSAEGSSLLLVANYDKPCRENHDCSYLLVYIK